MPRNYYPNISIPLADLPGEDFTPGPPVLIVGMHNSGTSILAEIIHDCGIFLCPDMRHHECRYFTHFVHDDLMLGSQERWADLPMMPVDQVLAMKPQVAELIRRYWIADYIRYGYDGKSPWGLKDPRLCIFLPLYLELFPDAKVVHIHRNPDDVAASLTRRPKTGLGIRTDLDFWKQLTAAYHDRCDEYVPKFRNHHRLSYEALCTDREKVVQPLLEFLELPPEKATPEVLRKLSAKRIGSHERYLAAGLMGKLKREVSSRLYRFLRPEISGK